MYKISYTTAFKRDIKLARKRGLNLNKLKVIIDLLEHGKSMPIRNKDHSLSNNWHGFRECHIQPDWLLIYRKVGNIIEVARSGTHSDLFKK